MNFEVVGIAKDTENATVVTDKPGNGPQKDLVMTKMQLIGNANGKLFMAVRDFDPNTPNVMGMMFEGQQVAIRKNEKFMGTNTVDAEGDRTKAYAFDIPMRFLEDVPFPKTYTFHFILGHMEGKKFIEETRSESFTLTINE